MSHPRLPTPNADGDAVLRRSAEQHLRQGRLAEAADAWRRLAPRSGQADDWYNLGYLCRQLGRFDEALDAYAQALTQGVDGAEDVHLNRAVILSDHLRRDDEAELELNAALARRPGYPPALLNLGNLHEERGRPLQALACYAPLAQQAAQRLGDGHDALRHEALARSVALDPPADASDARLAQLRAAPSRELGPVTSANCLFAVGQALDRLGEYGPAFAAFAEANRHARVAAPIYDAARERAATSALVAADLAAPAPGEAASEEGPQPLFICGMYRSGSTLVERVLAAHPLVVAGDELDLLPRWLQGPLAPFPASMAQLDPARAAELATQYSTWTQRLFPQAEGRRYITDKRPDNYQLIGVIRRLFPGAKIIHTVRHPLDTGLSVFSQHLNPRRLPYATDLSTIGHHVGEYHRLMAHWKQRWGSVIHDFDYDRFVREPRAELEALLAFLGLPWDDRCLQFHEQPGTVKTASYWQVRRPLYRESSGRWRRYQAWLGPLQRSLAEAGVPIEGDEEPARLLDRADALLGERQRMQALDLAAQAEARASDDGELLCRVAGIRVSCNEPMAALTAFERARTLLGESPRLLYETAAAQFFTGRFDSAEANLNRLLALDPQAGHALYLRSTLQRQRPDANHVAELQARLGRGFARPVAEAACLFALAKELEDLGRHTESFEVLSRAAPRMRSTLGYEVEAECAAMQGIRSTYTAAVMATSEGVAAADGAEAGAGEGVVFIVGMPRSGTTLLERVLVQRFGARSAGELNDFARLLGTAAERALRPGQTLAQASLAVDFDALGRDYVDGARQAAAGSPLFIDKMPVNFLYAGMIRKALPRARIIHLVRDPLDACYAVYKTLFFGAYHFSYDLDELARYYIAYRGLMDHWHAVMPGAILDVHYEDLVADDEAQTQRIARWCGFDASAAAAATPLAEFAFTSASAAQVREPLHRRSVGSAARHAAGLAPLRARLEAAGLLRGAVG